VRARTCHKIAPAKTGEELFGRFYVCSLSDNVDAERVLWTLGNKMPLCGAARAGAAPVHCAAIDCKGMNSYLCVCGAGERRITLG
jgi:hypothetical protein